MNEQETRDFLLQNGVQPLDLNNWQPHLPILFLLKDTIRADLDYFPNNKKPSILRINDPVRLYIHDPARHALHNQGGQIDYYAINPKTKEINLVKTSANSKRYFVTVDSLFVSSDNLFPKG